MATIVSSGVFFCPGLEFTRVFTKSTPCLFTSWLDLRIELSNVLIFIMSWQIPSHSVRTPVNKPTIGRFSADTCLMRGAVASLLRTVKPLNSGLSLCCVVLLSQVAFAKSNWVDRSIGLALALLMITSKPCWVLAVHVKRCGIRWTCGFNKHSLAIY